MNNIIIILLILIVAAAGVWFLFLKQKPAEPEPVLNNPPATATPPVSAGGEAPKNPVVTFITNKGDIKIEMFADKMPVTTGNFLKLAGEGFYNGTKFHRVISGFMIQGGDPNSKGTDESLYGRGGPGYAIQDEFAPGNQNDRGTIAMANAGPNTGGSQFFINIVNNNFLDTKHPVFGKVVAGMDIADKIANSATKKPGDIPVDPVIIEKVEL